MSETNKINVTVFDRLPWSDKKGKKNSHAVVLDLFIFSKSLGPSSIFWSSLFRNDM